MVSGLAVCSFRSVWAWPHSDSTPLRVFCLPDGTRRRKPTDGRVWTEGKEVPFVQGGDNSKPTFDRFGGVYYLGWQDGARVNGVSRSVFNLEVSVDGKTWVRKYRFETEKSFQYPTFREYEGTIYVLATQGDTSPSRKERIVFGKLEDVSR